MANGRRKIAVIGAGNVGATCAFVLAQMKLGDVVMLDIYEGFAKGKALDMSQGGQILNYDGKISGTKDYEDIEGADVVVVTSGFPRKPGMTREDLVGKNADIISQVGQGIREHAPDSVIVMVTNRFPNDQSGIFGGTTRHNHRNTAFSNIPTGTMPMADSKAD